MPEKNVLFLAAPEGDKVPALLDPDLARLRDILLAARKLRKQPSLDTKIITSWNALMIRALATAGSVLQERKYLDAAVKAAEFLLKNHRAAGDVLYRTSRDGVTKYAGFLDDYAFFIQAMLALADGGASERWKDSARTFSQVMLNKFGDPVQGGFFFNEENAGDLIVRQKIASDSPLPSGNGVAAMLLLALEQPADAGRTVTVFARQLERQAEGMSALLLAVAMYVRERGPLVAPAGGKVAVAPPRSPQELSQDVVSIEAIWRNPTQLDVQLKIQDGMHISAHDTVAGLMATQLAISGDAAALVASIEYPPAQPLKVSFSELAINGYQQTIIIKVAFKEPPHARSKLQLALHYQPCDEQACLAVASKHIEVEVPSAGRSS
jgi:uncharacterized protein YyaL (SSP411 family)